MRLTIHCEVDAHIARVIRKIGRLAAREVGFDDLEARSIEAALNEALSNSFVHAYHENPGRVEVTVEFENESLVLTVGDDGDPIARKLEIPKNLQPSARGGRGLYLIARLMDDVEIIHPVKRGRGTLVRMIKKLPLNQVSPQGTPAG